MRGWVPFDYLNVWKQDDNQCALSLIFLTLTHKERSAKRERKCKEKHVIIPQTPFPSTPQPSPQSPSVSADVASPSHPTSSLQTSIFHPSRASAHPLQHHFATAKESHSDPFPKASSPRELSSSGGDLKVSGIAVRRQRGRYFGLTSVGKGH